MSKGNRDYRVGAPQTDRVALCTTKAEEGSDGIVKRYVDDDMLELKHYRVHIDVPRYRLENKRTKNVYQPSYIKANNLNEDHFSDVENDQAQKDQHNILLSIARGKEGKKVGFESEMKGPQKEPIIVQGNGEILSGNTRTSIWRELYHSDPEKYKHHKKLDILFYPTTDEIDEMRFENYEDIKREVKIQYNWYEEASTFQSQLEELGFSMKNLVKMSGKTRKTIETLIDSKKYAEEFLKRYPDVSPLELIGAGTQFAFRGISEVCTSLENNSLNPEKILSKKLMLMTIRRSVIKDKSSGKPEVSFGGKDKYKLFKTLLKLDDSNKAYRLNEVIKDISNWSNNNNLEKDIRGARLSAPVENEIVRHGLQSMKQHLDADSQETYKASISAALTSISDAYKNWITNGKEKIDSQTKQNIKDIKKTIDKFSS